MTENNKKADKNVAPLYQLIEEDISVNYNPNKKKKEQNTNIITGKTE